MQNFKEQKSSGSTIRRMLSARWVKAAALALVVVFVFAAIWFIWLQPAGDSPDASASADASPTLTETPALSPTPAAAATVSPTPSPTLTPSPVLTPAILPEAAACRPGDTGENVELLQTMLLALGFDPGDADGVYGAQLKAAVYNFQLYEGIPANGIADEQTAAAITQRWQAAQRHEAVAEQPLAGCVIGIDAGHQRHANPEQEPISPGSDITKDKVSSGTEGQFTGIPEYVVNLQVALKLKAVLEALGAEVVMTRETHDVDIPNSARARMMNEAGVDCWLRIHANYTRNPSIHGMFILVPPKGGLDTNDPTAVEKSVALAEMLLECALQATGADGSRGLEVRDDQTGFGWSQVPVCNIEMGYMSNEAEDRLLVTEAYQQKIVDGLVSGFVRYFSGGES